MTFAERPLDNVLRSLAIDAMTEMNKAPIPASWAERLKPSVMGILVGLGTQNVSEPPQAATPPSGSASAPNSTRAGWQIYLHSSAKGSPKQANLHPELTNHLQKVGLTFHHFSGMCAEMALLTNYLYDNPKALATGRFPAGSVYMMTYTATNFPGREPGVGKFLKPCNHANCGAAGGLGSGSSSRHDLNPQHHGCQNVFEKLGINLISAGSDNLVPSETEKAVVEEQAERQSTPIRAQPNPPKTSQTSTTTTPNIPKIITPPLNPPPSYASAAKPPQTSQPRRTTQTQTQTPTGGKTPPPKRNIK